MVAGIPADGRDVTWINRVFAGVGGLYALTLLTLAVPTAGDLGRDVSGLSLLVFSLVGAGAAGLAGARPGLDRRDRLVWRTLAAGLLLQLTALLLFVLWPGDAAFPAPGDIPRIGFVILLCAAAWLVPLHRVTALERRKSVLDSLTVMVSAAMLLWYLILGPHLAASGTSTGVVAAAMAYPLLDLLTIFGFSRVLVRNTGFGTRGPVLLLAVGAFVLFLTDGWSGYLQAHAEVGIRGSALEYAGVVTAQLCFALAALDQLRTRPGTAPRRDRCVIGGNLPYAAIAVAYALMAVAAWQDRDRFPWTGLVTGGIAITALVVLRQMMVQRASEEAASTDGLTGLANRSRFHDVLARGLDRDARAGRHTAVLLVDLNGFKQVNDSLGHTAGDRLLVAFAGMLRGSILGSDLAGRLGGDEFAVVLHDIGSVANAEAVARRIVAAAAEEIPIDGTAVTASASIGIAVSGPDELSPDELLHRADAAMYSAKRRGGGTRWTCFEESMGEGEAGEPSLEDDLRTALAEGGLRLLYQPIVGLPEEELLGVEALVHWEHPRHGTLESDAIAELAERLGLGGELGRWVLREAATQAQRWPGLRLHVNITPGQLAEDRFSADVRALIRSTGMDPALLVLEVAESASITGDVPRAHLQILTDEGVRVALDHFGTGYSSLTHLTQLPIDMLKIDRGFVAALDGTAAGAAVAQAVLRLGRVLSLETVADGVATVAQARELTLLGGVQAQGDYFGGPQPADRISTLVAASGR
jgi:diguanylate cyclase